MKNEHNPEQAKTAEETTETKRRLRIQGDTGMTPNLLHWLPTKEPLTAVDLDSTMNRHQHEEVLKGIAAKVAGADNEAVSPEVDKQTAWDNIRKQGSEELAEILKESRDQSKAVDYSDCKTAEEATAKFAETFHLDPEQVKDAIGTMGFAQDFIGSRNISKGLEFNVVGAPTSYRFPSLEHVDLGLGISIADIGRQPNLPKPMAESEYGNRHMQLEEANRLEAERRKTPEYKLEMIEAEAYAYRWYLSELRRLEWHVKEGKASDVTKSLFMLTYGTAELSRGQIDEFHLDLGYGMFAVVNKPYDLEEWEVTMELVNAAKAIVDEEVAVIIDSEDESLRALEEIAGMTVNAEHINKDVMDVAGYLTICHPDTSEYFHIIPMEVWNAE